ncbi:O-antigen ligase family protein [Candidatus Gracilibacteria bacterium]|nr:O-antigen ligase family protein [Candidatus Gracilibacteria bacterium]
MLKILFSLFLFLLPLHALVITTLKCRFEISVDYMRFWKELFILGALGYAFYLGYKKAGYSLKKLYKNNTLLGLTTAYIICSVFFIYFPFMELKAASVLGFRYNVFFLLAFLIGLYIVQLKDEIRPLLKTTFIISFGIIIVFLPWFLFGDIASKAAIFGYSTEVSTYTANQCLSFAQNVTGGHHRLQASFGSPINFSVYLTLILTFFIGWLLTSPRFTTKQKYLIGGGFTSLCLAAIFFAYTKTSLLGVLFSGAVFSFLSYKYVLKKQITRKFYIWLGGITFTPIVLVALFKWELFLHLGAVLNRLDNLSKSVEMFFYNPFGYGLGIAGPASQIGNSIESAGDWVIATNTTQTVHRFLPENWFVQVLLEQGIIGLALFAALFIVIGVRLFNRIKRHKDYLSVAGFTAFVGLCFMGLFIHVFEDAAISYTAFLIFGILLADSVIEEQKLGEKTEKENKK